MSNKFNRDNLEFILNKNKRLPNKQSYYYHGKFSGAKGIRILVGNIWANMVKINEECKKELKEELGEEFNEEYFDEDIPMNDLENTIINAITHEILHKIMYDLFLSKEKYYRNIDKLQNGIDSEIIRTAINYAVD